MRSSSMTTCTSLSVASLPELLIEHDQSIEASLCADALKCWDFSANTGLTGAEANPKSIHAGSRGRPPRRVLFR
jgi:hypothetical protein